MAGSFTAPCRGWKLDEEEHDEQAISDLSLGSPDFAIVIPGSSLGAIGRPV
jgi:hypothetical protein